ncbi:MAG: hypothetical protein K6E20_01560 [Acholeplasmatales bacterium]|nr:hypothetical protein [Acholeplasmatales bacterium]
MMILLFLLNLSVIAFGCYELPKYIDKLKRFFFEMFLLAIETVIMLYQTYLIIHNKDIGWYNIFFIVTPLLYLLYLLYVKIHYRSLSLFSIYEGINKLDEGMMIAKGGHVIFQNEALDKLVYILLKTKIRNYKLLLKRLEEVKDSSIEFNSLICVRANDRIYAFSYQDLGDTYIEINSTDVTEEIALINELKKVLDELKDTEGVLNDYLNNIEKLEYEKQKNFMLNKIHNVLSYKISILNKEIISKSKYDKKIYEDLSDFNADMFDQNKLVENNINELNLDLAPIGAKVIVNGKCPFNLLSDELIFEIIREATTNAIYHGNASDIIVNFYDNRLEITNNGINEDVLKKGKGLTLLEKRCHERGWKVSFLPNEGFKIIVYYGENV